MLVAHATEKAQVLNPPLRSFYPTDVPGFNLFHELRVHLVWLSLCYSCVNSGFVVSLAPVLNTSQFCAKSLD